MKTYNEILSDIFNGQIENIKKDILKFNPKVTDFIINSEKTKDYNIFLIYGTGHGSVFSHIYRMVIIDNSFVNASPIFKDGNVICNDSYTLENVKEKAKYSLNNALKQL